MTFDYSSVEPAKAEILKKLGLRIREIQAGRRTARSDLSAAQRRYLRELRKANRNARKSCVYFLEAVGSGRVKIGKAVDVEKRISELQTGCPFRLSLIGFVVEPKFTESQLHSMFGEHRVCGEWFTLTDEIRQFVSENGGGE